MSDGGDGFVMFMAGVIMGAGATFFLLIGSNSLPRDAYTQAYKDCRAGKIEQVMREKYPHNWVKLNPLPKENK